MKYIKKAVSFIAILVALVLIPFNSFAMDTVFINNPEIWYANDEIIHTPEQQKENYRGIYSYYIDTENTCFYLHISYDEKNLRNTDNDIKVEFNILNNTNSYTFIINETGMINADNETEKAFDIAYNFGTATTQGQEIYLGIEFKNKSDKILENDISFSLVVNGKAYKLSSYISLPFYQNVTTNNTTNEKTAKTTTRKNDKTTAKGNNSSKASTETTKFKYVAGPNSNNTYHYEADDYNSDDFDSENYNSVKSDEEENIILTEKYDDTPAMPTSSKVMIAVAVISIGTGVAIAIHSVHKYQKAKETKETFEEKE